MRQGCVSKINASDSPGFANIVFLLTLVSGAALCIVAAVFYIYLDQLISLSALELEHTPWHFWAGRISLLADHTVVFAFIALGLVTYAVARMSNLERDHSSDWVGTLACVCLSACVAIACVETIKIIFGRCRPQLLFSDKLYGFTWWSEEYVRNSFPSGHTTRAFSLAMALSLSVRWLTVPALLIAVLVGVSRVLALKHYASDVLAGAWLGSIVACWVWFFWNHKK